MEDLILKLDYSLKTTEERNELVNKIIETTNPEALTPSYLSKLSNYLISVDKAKNKKTKEILTDNRMITIYKRETSMEKLIDSFKKDNCEDSVYAILNRKGDKNVRLTTQKQPITEKDLAEVPGLQQLKDAIESIEAQIENAVGKNKFYLKQQAIEMRKEQYLLRSEYKKPIYANYTKNYFNLKSDNIYDDSSIEVSPSGDIRSDSKLNFLNPAYILAFAENYDLIKTEAKEDSTLVMLFENYINILKEKETLFYDLFVLKLKGKTNSDIQKYIEDHYGVKYCTEYISTLWKRRFPNTILKYAEKEYLEWYFTFKEKGKWKKCSKCGEVKLRLPKFFSYNRSIGDGYYSICKECRKKKYQKQKEEKKCQ